MSGDAPPGPRAGPAQPRWLFYALILGFYLTCRGYHSLDGDQAYRLPLLLHQQDSRVFADDPFVQAFEAFNPHRGSLMVLDLVTRPLGLSAGLFTIFVLTFGATCLGVDRLSRAVWPNAGSNVGLVAVGLVLVAKAGNIGTNHLFEAMVLDRLTAFALGWLAFAYVVADPARADAGDGHTRAGDPDSSFGRIAARHRAGSELDGLVSAGQMDGSRPPHGLYGRGRTGGRGDSGTGCQPGARFFAAGRYASPRFLAPDRRAAKPPAHAAPLVEDAAMAGLGLLPRSHRTGLGRRLPSTDGNRERKRPRVGADSRMVAVPTSFDGALDDHPVVVRSIVVCHRGTSSTAGDRLPTLSHGDDRAWHSPGSRLWTAGGPLAIGLLAGPFARDLDPVCIRRRLVAGGCDLGRADCLRRRSHSEPHYRARYSDFTARFPPLRRGGQGGWTGHNEHAWPSRQFREAQQLRTRVPRPSVPPGPPPLTPPSQGGEKCCAEIGMNSELVQSCRFITPPPRPPFARRGEFIALLQDWTVFDAAAWFGVLALGFNFLAHHDTEFGNRTLLIALSIGLFVGYLGRERASVASWPRGIRGR